VAYSKPQGITISSATFAAEGTKDAFSDIKADFVMHLEDVPGDKKYYIDITLVQVDTGKKIYLHLEPKVTVTNSSKSTETATGTDTTTVTRTNIEWGNQIEDDTANAIIGYKEWEYK